jgi:hypothetical protein
MEKNLLARKLLRLQDGVLVEMMRFMESLAISCFSLVLSWPFVAALPAKRANPLRGAHAWRLGGGGEAHAWVADKHQRRGILSTEVEMM